MNVNNDGSQATNPKLPSLSDDEPKGPCRMEVLDCENKTGSRDLRSVLERPGASTTFAGSALATQTQQKPPAVTK